MQNRAPGYSNLRACQRKIDSLISAIEDGLYLPSMKARLEDLETEKDSLLREIALMERTPRPVSVHPNLAEVYRRKVEELERLLVGPQRDEAMEIIRAMIEQIVLTPRAQGPGLDAELHGDLARILAICSGQNSSYDDAPEPRLSGRLTSVVAGRGFEPLTFRL